MKKYLCLSIALILVFSICLTACNNKVDFDEIEDKIWIDTAPSLLYLSDPRINFEPETYHVETNVTNFACFYEEFSESEWYLSLQELAAEEYELLNITSVMGHNSNLRPETYITVFPIKSPNGENHSIVYESETKKVVCLDASIMSRNPSDKPRVDLETAKNNALEYIEKTINVKYDRNIDVSKHELLTAREITHYSSDSKEVYSDKYVFLWGLFYNNVCINYVYIETTVAGEPCYFFAPTEISSEVYKKIPYLTLEEYTQFGKRLIQKGFQKKEEDVFLSDVRLAEVTPDNYLMVPSPAKIAMPVLIYDHHQECYAIRVGISWDTESFDGRKRNDDTIHYYIPLDD